MGAFLAKPFSNANRPASYKSLFTILLFIVALAFMLFKHVEVVAPGTGVTTIKESNVVVKAPVSAYIVDVKISEGMQVKEQQPLFVYRNLADEYELSQASDGLKNDTALQKSKMEERCFLTAKALNEGDLAGRYSYGCEDKTYSGGAGGQYVLQFYNDYLQERLFNAKVSEQRQKKMAELFRKKDSIEQKRSALKMGQGETFRFYDLDISLADIKGEIVQFQITENENEKKVNEKLITFEMHRAERLLKLDEDIERLQTAIIEQSNKKKLLEEKQSLSILRSPVNGTVLKMTDGVSNGVFAEQGTQLFVLKKVGFSQEVDAKFDTRYRNFLEVGKAVKLKITAPGFLQLFDGYISEISSDAIEYEDSARAGRRYYRATIIPDESFINLSLNLGMDVEIYVIDKEVSALDYIMSVIPFELKFNVW
jgi:multidrug efflux pump subunit AcrA (membrane-fusion protein)